MILKQEYITVIDENDPKNGWIIICHELKEFMIVKNHESMAHILRDMLDRVSNKNTSEIDIYELGRKMECRLNYVVSTLVEAKEKPL